MRLEFEVELPDAPGELSKLLQLVAKFGGNVGSVLHRHEAAADGRVPVSLVVDVPEEGSLRLLDALARAHRLLRVNREGGPVHASVLLLGHVFEAGLTPILDAAFEAGAEVSGVDARIAGRANPSAALVKLTANDAPALAAALDALRARAAEHRLSLLEQAWGNSDD